MKTIKLTIDYPREWILRQSPKGDGIWNDYKFFVNDDTIKECDFWVFYSKGRKNIEKCVVSPQNVITIIGEPPSVYHFSKAFLHQFNHVVSNGTKTKYKKAIFNHPMMPWWVGIENSYVKGITIKKDNKILNTESNSGNTEKLIVHKNFNDFNENIFEKANDKISVILSNKTFTKGHLDRYNFVISLKKYFGNNIDIFGSGFNKLPDKWDALAKYKYHIAIENTSMLYNWTEKIADPFLTNTLPIYYGCANLNDFFDPNSYQNINIHNLSESIKTVKNVLDNNTYESSLNYIIESKQRVLFKYNLFAEISKFCDNLDAYTTKEIIKIKKDKLFFDSKKVLLLLKRHYYKWL